MRRIYQACLLAFACVACAPLGINIKHKTPAKAFKYPQFNRADSLRGQLTPLRSCYDVTFYSINIDVDIKNKFLSGYVDFYFNCVNPFRKLQIDLYKNMQIDSIVYAGKKLAFTREFNAVFVDFKDEVQTATKSQFRVYYRGKPRIARKPPWEGGFVWEKDSKKRPWVGVACEVDGASLWWPVKDHLSDEPDSVAMNVTIPGNLQCVSNGLLVEKKELGHNTMFCWKTSYPINTYNVTLYIGDFKKFSIPYKSIDTTFNLDFYVHEPNLVKAQEHFKQCTTVIKTYEQLYGPYPWRKEDFKLVESPFEGMEHQTAIAYGNAYKNNLLDRFDYIIVHETAHEWWGNSLTVSDYADVWLHEGFATYSEALLVEKMYNFETYQRYMAFYSYLIQNKRPVVGPFDVNYWDYKDGDVYMKGALVLHTLRNILSNDSLFFDILHSFYNKFEYKTVHSADFVDMVNQKTGKDFSWFFKQYLYSRVCPTLEIKVENTPNETYNISYRWAGVGSDFQLPVKVYADYRTYVIYPSNEVKILKLKTDEDYLVNSDGSYIAVKKIKKF
jgi:aminopeptidase N